MMTEYDLRAKIESLVDRVIELKESEPRFATRYAFQTYFDRVWLDENSIHGLFLDGLRWGESRVDWNKAKTLVWRMPPTLDVGQDFLTRRWWAKLRMRAAFVPSL